MREGEGEGEGERERERERGRGREREGEITAHDFDNHITREHNMAHYM